jgi:hypothetical protein
MTSVDDLVDSYRKADRRLRQALLGDGVYSPGLVKGDEARGQVARELGRLRDAFSALVEIEEARAGEAEAKAADLEEALKVIASTAVSIQAEPSS